MIHVAKSRWALTAGTRLVGLNAKRTEIEAGATMITRRTFVSAVGASTLASSAVTAQPPARRRRLAVVTTEWRERSHAWHMAERFLHGYPIDGRWHRPPFEGAAGTGERFARSLARETLKNPRL